MNNAELKHLVELYRTTKKDLSDLISKYDEGKVEKELFERLEKIIVEKNKTAKGLELSMWKAIHDGVWHEEWQVAYNKCDDGDKKVQTTASYDIAYLTAKLECIKEMLGDEIVKKIEAYEEKRILKG